MIVVSNSKVKLWRRCRQAFYYKDVEKLQKRVKALPLERGIILHSLIEAFYRSGKKAVSWIPTWEGYRREYDKLMDEEKEYYGDLPYETRRIMEGYAAKYMHQKEKAHAIELDFSKTPVEVAPGVALKGRIDLILEDAKGTWIVEHKSTKSIPGEESRFLDLQTSVYITVAEALGYKIDGVLWDYLKTKPPTIPRTLQSGEISRAQNIDTDYPTYYNAILSAGLDPKDYEAELERVKNAQFYVRKYLPKSQRVIDALLTELVRTAKEIARLANYPYRNIDRFNCRNCDFRPLCEAEVLGLDSSFIRKSEYKVEEDEEGGDTDSGNEEEKED